MIVENSKVVRRYKSGYEIREEVHRLDNEDNELVVRSAYTLSGDYVGNTKTAHKLCTVMSIKPEKISPKHSICSIGFSNKSQKYFGWSHRAIYGFGIGSKVEFGDCGYTADTPENFKKAVDNFWNDMGKPGSNSTSYKSYFIDAEEFMSAEELGYYRKDYGPNSPVCAVRHESSCIQDGTGKVLNFDFNSDLPAYGKGEWTAETLEDAKQMAIDFANGVS